VPKVLDYGRTKENPCREDTVAIVPFGRTGKAAQQSVNEAPRMLFVRDAKPAVLKKILPALQELAVSKAKSFEAKQLEAV